MPTCAARSMPLVDVLARGYPLEHKVIVYRTAMLPVQSPRIRRIVLGALPQTDIGMAVTVRLPPDLETCMCITAPNQALAAGI